jgi:outer membrane protein assembly factor BamB
MKLYFSPVSWFRALIAVWLIIFLAACASTDNSEPPAPLTEIKNGLKFNQLLTIKTGAGISSGSYNRQPLLIGDEILTVDADGLIKKFDANSGKLNWEYETNIQSITGLIGNDSIIIASSRN